MAAKIETNIRQVRREVKKLRRDYQNAGRDLVAAIGQDAQKNIQANIAPRPGGVFPGYAMRGALRRAVVRIGPTKIGRSWQMIVMVQRSGSHWVYARIHEIGGIIKAKRAPYLVFFIPGVGWRKAKQVTIQAKHYFKNGVDRTRQRWSRTRLRKFLASRL